MKNIILLLFVLVFASSLFAGKKNADAVYLKLVKEYTLHEDGRITYHQNHQLQLLSYYAFSRRYGETFVVYDTTHQKLTVQRNVTTMADGKKVTAPANAFNLVLPRFARNAADYNHLREMVITHIGLEPDAIIDLDYEIESAADFLPGLMGDEILAEDSPVEELVLRIKIPAHKNLSFHLFNSNAQPASKTENGQKIYEWTFLDVPALVREPIQASAGDFRPRLQFSTVDNLGLALKPLFARFNSFNPFHEFKLEGSSELERILKLHKRVVQEMGTFPIPLATVGYRFRSPDRVWQSNGGTPLEKAIFMASILAESGINAKPVLVASNKTFDPAVASLLPFRKAGVCVHLANGQAFMLSVDDLNVRDLRYTYGGRQALVFKAEGIKIPALPKPKAEQHAAEMDMQIEINAEDKLSGQFDLHLSGATQPYLELQRKQDHGESLLKKICPQSKLTRLAAFSDTEVQLQASFEQADTLSNQKDYLFYDLPENPYGIAALHLPTLTKTRQSPVQIPYENFSESSRYSITIPDHYKIITIAEQIERENEVGKLKIIFTRNGQNIEIERSLLIKKREISLTEYAQFFELLRLWNAPVYQQVIFKKH